MLVAADYGSNRNLMIRLNINDQSNLIDGTNPAAALSSLGQNYPNPFNAATEITYSLANDSEVEIEVRDITGRIIMQKNEGFIRAGKHTVRIDGSPLEAGIYLYSLRAGNFTETRRMTVAR
ncbi:MAG TPA: hypothetical protein DC042_06145 [Bacteroidales bacterium]|nr:hypothetical protein [Bacteroidales bacterium]